MLVTLEEMKNYLRVDYDDDDILIETLISHAYVLLTSIRPSVSYTRRIFSASFMTIE